MSPKALGLSEVKEDLFFCIFGCWVGEVLSAEVSNLLVHQSCPGLLELLLGQGLRWLPAGLLSSSFQGSHSTGFILGRYCIT